MEPIESLLSQLGDPSSQIRVKAARALSGRVDAGHRAAVVAAMHAEKDAYVKTAIAQLLGELGFGAPQHALSGGEDPSALTEARLRGEQDALRQFIHEIVPLYGLVSLCASNEVPNFPESSTSVHLARMLRYIQALKELSEAQSSPVSSAFDLADLICGEAFATQEQLGWEIATAGPMPLLVEGSAALVSLIVSNALRNAVEAERCVKKESTVVVAWGETGEGYWVSVVDRGVGLPPNVGRVFGGSVSMKENHAGMGLAISERAAASMGATLLLGPNAEHGSTLSLRWKRSSGNSA